MHKQIKQSLGKELKKQLKRQAKQEVLIDLAEDLMLQALDPDNSELSLKQKLILAKDIYKSNPELKLFDKDQGNQITIINYSERAIKDAEKQLKEAKGKVLEVKKFG